MGVNVEYSHLRMSMSRRKKIKKQCVNRIRGFFLRLRCINQYIPSKKKKNETAIQRIINEVTSKQKEL